MSIAKNEKVDIEFSTDNLDTAGFWASRDETTQSTFNEKILRLSRTGSSTEFCEILERGSSDISTNNIDLDITDNLEWTPLIHASFNGHLKIIENILNFQENKYFTENINNNKKIQLLFKNFLQRRVKWNGSTALHLASARGHTEIANLLIKKSIKYNGNLYTIRDVVNASDYDLATPLHCAVLGKHYQTANLLLKYGATTNKSDIRGKTPLDWCKSRGQIQYITLLNNFENNNNVQQIKCYLFIYYLSSNILF